MPARRPPSQARLIARLIALCTAVAAADAGFAQGLPGLSGEGSGSRYDNAADPLGSPLGQPAAALGQPAAPMAQPAPPSTFAAPGDSGSPEAIAPPETETAPSGPTPVTAAQPVAEYDYGAGTWLPMKDPGATGWLPEIEVPANLIDCTCGGQAPGPRCRVWRSFVRPTDPSIDQRCVVCIKEPYLAYETAEEEFRVVIHRCFESTEKFSHTGCEGGHCYEATGTTRLRKLHPCEAKATVRYQKPVIRYQDVFYYVQCDCE